MYIKEITFLPLASLELPDRQAKRFCNLCEMFPFALSSSDCVRVCTI